MFAQTHITLQYIVTMIIFDNYGKGHAFLAILPKKYNLESILLHVGGDIK